MLSGRPADLAPLSLQPGLKVGRGELAPLVGHVSHSHGQAIAKKLARVLSLRNLDKSEKAYKPRLSRDLAMKICFANESFCKMIAESNGNLRDEYLNGFADLDNEPSEPVSNVYSKFEVEAAVSTLIIQIDNLHSCLNSINDQISELDLII